MTKPLWTIGEMVKAVRGKCAARASTPVSGISIDSRSLAPDEAFLALRGANRDGQAFVAAERKRPGQVVAVSRAFLEILPVSTRIGHCQLALICGHVPP